MTIFKFLQTAGFQSPTSAMLFATIMTPLMTYTKSFTGVFIKKSNNKIKKNDEL